MELTPAITQYIEEKIGSLDRYAENMEKDGDPALGHEIVEAFVEIGRTTKHHRKAIFIKRKSIENRRADNTDGKRGLGHQSGGGCREEDLKIELEKLKAKETRNINKALDWSNALSQYRRWRGSGKRSKNQELRIKNKAIKVLLLLPLFAVFLIHNS